MKAVFSTVALAAMVVGCGVVADPAQNESGDDSTSDLRAGQKVIQVVTQHNLVSDQPGQADSHDEDLVNAWGLAFSPKGEGSVSAAERGISPVFNGKGSLIRTVTIPGPEGDKGSHPTGQVFNGVDSDFSGDVFIFVTEDGTVAGWQPGMDASLRFIAEDGAIYKGVAIAETKKGRRAYATDFHNDKIDVFDSHYQLLEHDGGFVDEKMPAGFAPFNALSYKNLLLVTYAKQGEDAADDVPAPGNGFVDVFDAEGHFVERLISRGELNSPWGIAIASNDFGRASNKLLVGNFGDGHINAYELSMHGFALRAKFAGQLGTSNRTPLVIDGLWSIVFGPGVNGFDEDEIYFTAGPDDEEHGLFGELAVAGKK